ncbi:triacylglycerol lipase [Onchocerca flexuosa]|uniref:Triacylglycerol lipase n=1 Tax=Onchocerca flexuosa TaxID=387005 RepID=A0A238BVN1_9BILA|nr:triacylglycerol lipase [Onchocerca flexuosa]
MNENDPINKRPVLFVHGAFSRAAIFLKHREYFIYKGYSWSELYATSYGDGVNSAIFDGVHCKYVKQIRQMLLAINNYTGKTVDIIAHSMGSAVSRKAILGSFCFDTGELLGTPLTQLVNTFITVGGANHGLQICPSIVSLCGNISSLHCNSKLMKELNSQSHRFEGRSSYDIHSLSDSIIGLNCCNKTCGILPNHNASFELNSNALVKIFLNYK